MPVGAPHSYGIILWELLTGKRVWVRERAQEGPGYVLKWVPAWRQPVRHCDLALYPCPAWLALQGKVAGVRLCTSCVDCLRRRHNPDFPRLPLAAPPSLVKLLKTHHDPGL